MMTPQMIGIKRLLLVAVLLALNIVFFVMSSVFFAPQIEKNTQSLKRVKSDVSRYQRDLNLLQTDLTQLNDQKEVFDQLEAREFFKFVNPAQHRALFVKLAEDAGVEAELDLPAQASEVYMKDLETVEWKLFQRSVTIKISAFDDVDVYRYIYGLQQELPGYLKFKDINLRRNLDFSEDVLKSIARGEFPVIIEASVMFDWYFMTPNATNQAGGL